MKRRTFLTGLLGTAVAPYAAAIPVMPPAPFFGMDIGTGDYETIPVWMKYLEDGTSQILWAKPNEPGWVECDGIITSRITHQNGAVNVRWTIANKESLGK